MCRLSSPSLSQAAVDGINGIGGKCQDIGIVTTPQLHFMVVAINTKEAYGKASLDGYYDKLSNAFKSFMALCQDKGSYKNKVVFDGANGVGAVSMKEFQSRLSGVLESELTNTGSC